MRLTPELEEVRQAVRKFVTSELEPLAKVIDETADMPEEAVALLARNGYLGMRLDDAYGGAGVGLSHYCLVLEELARSHRAYTTLVAATSGNTPTAIQQFGTEEQRRKYLPGLTDGTRRTAFALTEPEAGSDSAAMKTRAAKVAGGWVINGRKHFINGGDKADFVMVIAVTDAEKRARGGISAFLVERGTPGFSVTRVDTTIGSEAIKLAELTFEDCRIDDDALLGDLGQGFRIAMASLTEGRLSVSCSCIGTADRVLEMSADYAIQRHTFGKPLAERQAIQWMLADSAVELAAARALTYSTIQDAEAGIDTGSRPSMAKLYCSEMVGRVTDRAIQVHGGMGVIRGFPIERFYRDVRHYRVGEGTSEVQRMLIARELTRLAKQRA
jgi:acyl-CoA dehydrogenase